MIEHVSIPERILEVASKLTSQGRSPFSRKDIQEALPDILPASLQPTIQAMTQNAPGGAPIASAYWKKCFKRIARGKYVLLEKIDIPRQEGSENER